MMLEEQNQMYDELSGLSGPPGVPQQTPGSTWPTLEDIADFKNNPPSQVGPWKLVILDGRPAYHNGKDFVPLDAYIGFLQSKHAVNLKRSGRLKGLSGLAGQNTQAIADAISCGVRNIAHAGRGEPSEECPSRSQSNQMSWQSVVLILGGGWLAWKLIEKWAK